VHNFFDSPAEALVPNCFITTVLITLNNRYLAPQQSLLTDADWAELKKRLREQALQKPLYLPTKELRAIGVLTVPWSGVELSLNDPEADFLIMCGVLGHPEVHEIVALCW
jgi:Protein of unknown function (DUF3684)